MQIAILGATGRLGRAVTAAAVDTGHTVVAVVRRTGGVEARSGVTERCLDLRDPVALAATLAGCGAVAVTIGTPPWSRQTVSAGLVAVLLEAMQRTEVRRLVVVSAFGIGDSGDRLPAPARWLLALARPYARDKAECELRVQSSDRQWTIVRPWLMRPGPASAQVRATTDPPRPQVVTYADVAAAIVAALADASASGQVLYLSRR